MRRLLNCLILLAALLALLVVAPLAYAAPVAAPASAPVAAPAPAPAAVPPDETSSQSVTVAVPVLNVRAGPGTGNAILGKVFQGTALSVLSKDTSATWLHVRASGGLDGWVFAEYTSQPAAPVDPTLPVRLVAPAIGLDTPVTPSGWHTVQNADGTVGSDWDVPDYAAGWLLTSSRPGTTGNAVLAGHHNIYGQVFRYVVNLKPGDAITVYTGERSISYRVVDRFILPDKYVSYEQRVANARWIGQFDDERLTLVTCWPYTNNTHRVIVIAKPVTQ